VTAIAGDPQENLDFYTGVLGLRLVKRSVNQDAPDTYHLFYADAEGRPGTDLTFFPWPDLPPGRPGPGQIVEVSFAVPPGSLAYWQERLSEQDVSTEAVESRFGERTLPLEDPHSLRLALVETSDPREVALWDLSPVPSEHQLRGLHAIRLWEHDRAPTETVLTDSLGLEAIDTDGDWHRYGLDGGASGTIADVKVLSSGNGRGGTGTIHHAAWRTRDTDESEALRSVLRDAGLRPTSLIDRFWFTSVYFREPGGALFELATDGPGFTADEDLENLGSNLVLPPFLESRREEIEASLPALDMRAPFPE
jgi:glyoxalase family protein